MSHRRPNISRRAGPGMPVDTLSSSPDDRRKLGHNHQNSPTRYKKGARSVQVPLSAMEDLSSKNFLPSTSARSSDHTTVKRHTYSDNIKEVINDNESFEAITDSSPLRKRPKHGSVKKGGLLESSSSPLTSPRGGRRFKSGITVSYRIPGEITIIDENNKTTKIAPINMSFNTDNCRNPYATFIHKQHESMSLSINLNNDCSELMFDFKNTCMGVVLRKSRVSSMMSSHLVRWKAFFWTNNESIEGNSNLEKISSFLMTSNPSYLVTKLKRAEDVRSRLAALNNTSSEKGPRTMADAIAQEAVKNRNPVIKRNSSLFNKDFNSLRNTKPVSKHSRSNAHSALSIRPPTDISKDEDTKPTGITPRSFYRNEPSDLSDHRLSVVRRSTRNQEKKTSHKVDLDLEEREVPKLFKPSLKYKFEDGSKFTITNQDFKCLYNNDWINDTIIDFFTKYYITESISKNITESNHTQGMSSFFYTKLISNTESYYDNVKKWVQNMDLITAKYIVVPINVNYHWFGCIIYNFDALIAFLLSQKERNATESNQSLQTNHQSDEEPLTKSTNASIETTDLPEAVIKNDSGTDESDDLSEVAPTIQLLTFDSLRGTHSRELDPIKEFLIAYAMDKYSITIDKTSIKMKTCLVPQQPNMSDCGVHVILTIKKFFEDPVKTIEVWRTAGRKKSRSSMYVNEYFEKNRRNMKARKELRRVLWDLQDSQIKYMKENNVNPEDSDDMKDISDDEGFEIIEDMEAYQIANKIDEAGGKESKINEPGKEGFPQIANDLCPTIEKSAPEETSLVPSEQLSSVPPSPVNSNSSRILVPIMSEDIPVRIPISVQLKDAIAGNSSESGSSPDAPQHNSMRSDVDVLNTAIDQNIELPSIKHTESKRRVSSKYFENRLTSRKNGFNIEQSPTLSDKDHRLASPSNELPEKNTEGSPQQTRLYENTRNSDDSNENIIVSDFEQDDDVNLIGHSSNVSIRVDANSDNPEEEKNTSDSLSEEETNPNHGGNTPNHTDFSNDGILKLHNDIDRELNIDESSNFVDLSSPMKPETPQQRITESNIRTASPSRIVIRDEESL